jgi:hypothetical protein
MTMVNSTPEPKPAESVSVVKYTGDAGVREITRAQWRAAGVDDQETTVWDESNNYTLLSSAFTPKALEIIKADRGLQIKQ